MGWSVDPVRPSRVLHYSEDPGITEFVPHVPATNRGQPPRVWAIEPAYAPLYWFPRDCARVTVWAHDESWRYEPGWASETNASQVAVSSAWRLVGRSLTLGAVGGAGRP